MMKIKLRLILTALLTILVFTPNAFAQDSPQWCLPEGAKACLGNGTLGNTYEIKKSCL